MSLIQVTSAQELTKALKAARAGDTIHMAPGVYQGNFKGSGPANKTNRIMLTGDGVTLLALDPAKDCLSLMNAPWWQVVGLITFQGGFRGLYAANCDHLEVRGVIASGCRKTGIMISSSDSILASGCEARGSVEEHGVYLTHCTDATLYDCDLHDNGGCGANINWQGAGDIAPDAKAGVVNYCRIHGNGFGTEGRGAGAGVNALSIDGLEVFLCDIYDCGGAGVAAGSSTGVNVRDSTIRIRKGIRRACVMSAAQSQVSVRGVQWEMGSDNPPFQTDHGGQITVTDCTPYTETNV